MLAAPSDRLSPDRLPLNRLEVAIGEAKAGRTSVAAMLRLLLRADLVLPSAAPVGPDGAGLSPLVLAQGDTALIVCFTALERVRGLGEAAAYALHAPARSWAPHVPDGCGLAVNPGQPLGFTIDPGGLRRARSALG